MIEVIESRDLKERCAAVAKRQKWADMIALWNPGDLFDFIGGTGYDLEDDQPLTYEGRTGLFCAILRRADGSIISGVEPDRLRKIIGRDCTEWAKAIGYTGSKRVLVVDGKAHIGTESIDWFKFCSWCRRGER